MVTLSDKNKILSELLLNGVRGDNVSYTRFLQNITPLLRRMISRKLAQSDVEDVVQEVLISVHKARHTFDGERDIMPWLVSIARFRITDHLRKYYATMRHQTSDISELENFLPDLSSDVTESYDNNESVEELLHDVPEKHRKILTLMHVEGYTAKEVGKHLDMNESAVKVAAHRAIKKIREKFGK
ncbi:MAG: sigma-70 family RNA polymerase sigma factor [Pseudomonadota bacterium]